MPYISPYEEKELLLELKQGNEKAFETIYKKYSKGLFGSLIKLVKSEFEAQEILQDVFLKIWDNREKIDVEKSFRSFLFKIGENKAYDFFRKVASDKKKKAEIIAIASSEYPLVEEQISSDKNETILAKAIESLPPQRQQVFRLCKLEKKSYKEVSQLLGISESTVSDHIVKATKAVRDYFENNEQALMALFVILFLSNV